MSVSLRHRPPRALAAAFLGLLLTAFTSAASADARLELTPDRSELTLAAPTSTVRVALTGAAASPVRAFSVTLQLSGPVAPN